MPVFKYFAVVGSALLVLLFVSNACLTDDDSNLRFDGSLYGSALTRRVSKAPPSFA